MLICCICHGRATKVQSYRLCKFTNDAKHDLDYFCMFKLAIREQIVLRFVQMHLPAVLGAIVQVGHRHGVNGKLDETTSTYDLQKHVRISVSLRTQTLHKINQLKSVTLKIKIELSPYHRSINSVKSLFLKACR